MAKHLIKIEIARPPHEVFAFMINFANLKAWTDMERMDLDGPLAAGTTGRLDLPMLGKSRTFPFVITAFESNRRWATSITNRLRVAFDYRLAPVGGGTRIEESIEVRPGGLLRLLAPLLGRMIRAEEAAELRRLKTAVEALPAGQA